MAAGTEQAKGPHKKVQGKQEGVNEKGIVLGHAYSILDVRL